MSKPLKEAVLLIMTGTRNKVLGFVSGPLKIGGGPGHFASLTCAMHTMPVDAAWTRDGKAWKTARTARIVIIDAIIRRLWRTFKIICTVSELLFGQELS